MTLLELLLAIALLLAVSGLVLPTLFERLRERAFESSAEIVRSQLLLARAHAQTTGELVEVMFATDPPRVAARRFDVSLATLEPVTDPDPADAAGTEARSGRPFEVTEVDDEQAEDSLRIPEPWAERLLADGVWISERSGLTEAAAGGPAPSADPGVTEDQDLEPPELSPPIRLALFMPDGSAVLAGEVWVRDEHGRRGRLSVNRWTGLPSFERVAEVVPEPDEEEEEPIEEEEPELDELEREFAEPETPEAAEDAPADDETAGDLEAEDEEVDR